MLTDNIGPFTILLPVLLMPVLATAVTAVFQWLWNMVMPKVLNCKKITFWQAFAIFILLSLPIYVSHLVVAILSG